MLGDRVSVFRGVFLNPLVWAGGILTALTLNYEKDVFAIFFLPKTYGLLVMGAGIYVALFGIHYTEEREHIDWPETLLEVIFTAGIILVSWFVSLSLIMGYRTSGENLRDRLAQRLQERAEAKEAQRRDNVSGYDNDDDGDVHINGVINNMGLQSGKSYVVKPQADGTIVIEVIEE
jgi:hypothetical protein